MNNFGISNHFIKTWILIFVGTTLAIHGLWYSAAAVVSLIFLNIFDRLEQRDREMREPVCWSCGAEGSNSPQDRP